jgi:hypothetical protein
LLLGQTPSLTEFTGGLLILAGVILVRVDETRLQAFTAELRRQAGGLESQVAAFRHAGRAARRGEVVGGRRLRVAGQLAQVRPDGEEPVMPGQPLVRLERRDYL